MPRDDARRADDRERRAPPIRWLVALGTVAAVALVATVLVFGHVMALAALVPLGLGVLAAARGRTWGVFVVLMSTSLLITAVLLSVLPWWLFIPGGLALLGTGAVAPALLRTDALATLAWGVLATAVGTGAAFGVAELPVPVGDDTRVVSQLDTSAYLDAETIAHRRGRAEAKRDIARGEPRWLTYGMPSVSRATQARLLEERYGVDLHAIAGCVVSAQILGRARGYNEVARAWLEERHGKDVIAETAADAREIERKKAERPRAEATRAAKALVESLSR